MRHLASLMGGTSGKLTQDALYLFEFHCRPMLRHDTSEKRQRSGLLDRSADGNIREKT
jgi:hypothetical protein